MFRANEAAAIAATEDPDALSSAATAADRSPAPSSAMTATAALAPTVANAADTVASTEFVVTNHFSMTTCGTAADTPAATKRPTPTTASAPTSSSPDRTPAARPAAVTTTSTARTRFAPTSTARRFQRSSSAPANGPSSEYGSSSTANPAATANGSVSRSGLNRIAPESAAWNIPSPNCPANRTVARRTRSEEICHGPLHERQVTPPTYLVAVFARHHCTVSRVPTSSGVGASPSNASLAEESTTNGEVNW